MKKLLFTFSLLISSVIYAADPYVPVQGDMNPFAYDLRSEFDETTMTLTGWFSVNAPSNKITVYAKDSEEIVYKILELSNQPALKNRQFTFSFQGHLGKDFTWYVDVEGTSHSQALFVSNSNKLYYPTSIDIDNNPENRNFGTVFCIEGRPNGKSDSQYLSSYGGTTNDPGDGAGLYIFNADGTKRALPRKKAEDGENAFGVDKERYGWNGGKTLNNAVYFNSTNTIRGFTPYRVRVSDDGRIFITTMTHDGDVLYEANQLAFNAQTKDEWEARNWSRVISKYNEDGKTENPNIIQKASSRDGYGDCTCGLGEYNIYNLYNRTTKEFVAGPNVGFDVRGSGNDLQLLMLSGCKQAIASSTPHHFYCSEYDLGGAITWNQAPKRIFNGHVLAHTIAQVQYDKLGNVWMCQYQETAGSNVTLMRYNVSTNSIDYSANLSFLRCGAFRFNNDFTKLAIATQAGSKNRGGCITIYDVDANTGMPKWNSRIEINVSDQIGVTMMDFAWDYAGNLYVAADNGDNSTKGRCVAIYAMPNNSDNVVSTPAAEKYEFSTKYSVVWKDILTRNQDVTTEPADSKYAGVNNRLWRLLQVGYNEYRYIKGAVYPNKVAYTKDRNVGNKTELDVIGFFNNENIYSVADFFENDPKFSWLGDYIKEKIGVTSIMGAKENCGKYCDDFINRNNLFKEYGKPEHWRSDFVEGVWGLKEKMGPNEYMPVQWNWSYTRDERYFDTIWIGGWTIKWYNNLDEVMGLGGWDYTMAPSNWYYFNHPRNRANEGISDLTHILAWRDGGVDGNIVHRVTRPNMELYATYVEKNIDENNPPANPANFDATNEELFQLLDNRNFKPDDPSVAPTHDLTVTRHLAAGMYNTICLPMNINLAGLQEETQDVDQHPLKYKADGSGATVLEFTGVTRTTNAAGENVTVLNFTQVTEMEAGKPYLVKLRDGAEDYTEKMPFTTVSVHADAYHPVKQPIPNTPQDVITFVPTINPTTIPAGSIILVADNRLALTTEEGQMAGLRGYFTVAPAQAKEIAEQAADGRVVLSVKQPVTTSVVDVQQPEVQAVQKILQDGNIYIIRGNEKYDLMGRLQSKQ